MIIPALYLIVGIIFARFFKELQIEFILPPLACAIIITRIYRKNLAKKLSLIFLTITGIVITIPYYNLPDSPHHIFNIITKRQTITVSGVLLKTPTHNSTKTRLLMAAKKIHKKNQIIPVHGRIQLALNNPAPPEISPGESFIVKATLDRISPSKTPGGFDYQKFLKQQDIFITGWVRSSTDILKINRIKQDLSFSNLPHKFSQLKYIPEQIRNKISIFLSNCLEQPEQALYKAVLIGDRYSIPPGIIENFKSTGSIHLLAISGLHMGLLALMLCNSLKWLSGKSSYILLNYSSVKLAAISALPVLTGYAFIAGFNPPVVRALIMSWLVFLALVYDNQTNLQNNIAIAALLILALEPTQLFTISFQLSFSAVIFISFLYFLSNNTNNHSNKETKETFSVKYIISPIILSIMATLGTGPLLLYYFNRLSLLSPISTLLTEPFICFWALPIGLIGVLFIWIYPPLSIKLFHLGSSGLTAACKINQILASFPWSDFYFYTLSLHEVIAIYILICLILFRKIVQDSHHRLKRNLLITTALVLLLINPIKDNVKKLNDPQLNVSIIDVGQGSSNFIHLPEGKKFLIDGGGVSSNIFDPGEKIISPFLWKKRIRHLDAIIITHPHADHYCGLPFLLDHFSPDVLWINGLDSNEMLYEKLLEIARKSNTKIKIAGKNELIFKGPYSVLKSIAGLHLKKSQPLILWKEDEENININNKSLVLKLESMNKSFIFPGDIEKEGERVLLESGAELKSDVLISPHHGSRSSSSPAFLNAVSPGYCFVSAGKFHPEHFPAAEVIKRMNEAGIKNFNTAVYGTVSCIINKKEFAIVTGKNEEVLLTIDNY
jgi:competence protein ComEC